MKKTPPAKCFSVLLGARATPHAGRKFTRKDDAEIRALTARYFPGGFTILHAEGGWFDPRQAEFIEEQSRQLLVLTSDRRLLRAWCAALAEALQQEELLVVEIGPARTFHGVKHRL